jgi:GH15 family glucan-1,4-alpha-glucosidase
MAKRLIRIGSYGRRGRPQSSTPPTPPYKGGEFGCVSRRAGSAAAWILGVLACTVPALATPDFLEHVPANAVYGEAAGVTMREPEVPREGEAVDLWIRVGYSFWYSDVAVYYTTDGSEPAGSRGAPAGTTAVLRSSAGQITFVRNEPNSPNIDWWKCTLPAGTRTFGTTVRYKIGAWDGFGAEIFANNYGCADGTCDNPAATSAVFQFTIRLAWPGQGHPYAQPGIGYPQVHLWKEEGVVGNNYINVMIDQNGSLYDIYYPSAGCRHGVGTKNEGYVDGADTFPPGLPPGNRGQMNVNQGVAGLRIDGVTYWLSNEGGAYTGVTQAYTTNNNTVHTASVLSINGYNIRVDQYDLSPAGIAFPQDGGGAPVRGIYLTRFVLTNGGSATRDIDFYYNCDFAINGGDGYDAMFMDDSRGVMVAYDNTYRTTSTSGEYNPTSFPDYTKNVSLYFGVGLKLCSAVDGAAGTPSAGNWRESSGDNAQGWIGLKLSLAPGAWKEVDLAIVGGFDNFAGATGTYNYAIAPAMDWFMNTSMAGVQSATEGYWTNWLASGVAVDTPDDTYDALFRRCLLATALHLDAKGGGVIAGMHDGAYPFVWPRDALYAAVTLDRTGHTAEAAEVYRFLRDVAYRANEEPGRKGFWYQKYTTDGYQVWTAPQVDETANVPWGGYYHYLTTGDLAFLNANYQMFCEAARAMSEDSSIDGRLYFDDPNNLMHGNNVWEDSWDDFLYSNAAVWRGLMDAAQIATITGHAADAALFTSRATTILNGINARLDWNGENTDISQLGLVVPFETHLPTDARMVRVIDRMNGAGVDRWGNNHPLVNLGGEWAGLINRYWGDTYWNGGPWFLSTIWYGEYYAYRQDHTAGRADIDNYRYRLDLLKSRLGPMGLGAEQIAPGNSLLYPGQGDFVLQAAWPNAWESMSTLADAIMLFLDHKPDAASDTVRLEPKLPTGWSTMTFRNLRLGSKRFDVTCGEMPRANTETFTNVTGGTIHYDSYIRIPQGRTPLSAKQDGTPLAWTHDPATGRVHVTGTLNPAAGSTTPVSVTFLAAADFDLDGDVDLTDFSTFQGCFNGPNRPAAQPNCGDPDLDNDADVDLSDFAIFQGCFNGPNRPAACR